MKDEFKVGDRVRELGSDKNGRVVAISKSDDDIYVMWDSGIAEWISKHLLLEAED